MVFGKKKPAKRIEFDEPEEDETIDVEDMYSEEVVQPPKPITKPIPQPQLKVEEPKQNWIVHDSPTEYQRVIVNMKTRKPYDLYSAIVECLNKLDEILKIAKEE